ncbi:dTDP-4-dehydrorhamnose reductase [Shewanella avicenniae]|uniref:dTDP-4-dehydrorhamnose reductase n=1 Tax=Shewanella avicenniae TaxID=2814294 RepID=A0ABX7QPN7_9GAMM|nr:dTDP-4-dehydrorhamnose reductase [Shewanella avicenniae]
MTVKLMVTGANGQVGTSLQQRAERLGWQVLAVDRNELDITDRAAVLQASTQFQPNVIINAAAHTAVDKAETELEASYAINRDGPQYLAEAASACNALLLHISTDYVFAGDKAGIYLETDPVAPQGVYGASKLAGELAVAQHCAKHLILRTAWVFGEHGNNFVKTMLRVGSMRASLNVVADQFGGPTYAGDIADALLTMAAQALKPEFSAWGVYHFSGAPHVSWHGFAEAIFSKAAELTLLDKVPTVNAISTSEYPTPARRPANSRLDCHKIQQVFGIEPSNWQRALANLQQYLPQ